MMNRPRSCQSAVTAAERLGDSVVKRRIEDAEREAREIKRYIAEGA